MQTQEPIIICRDVHKWYGQFHVLRGISLEVQRGEVVVIFGPSGSGKSTFIRTLNRLEEHQRGQIIVDGVELTSDVRNIERVRSETGMVFQSFNLFPHLTVLDNITLAPIWVRRRERPEAEAARHAAARARRHARAGAANIPASCRAASSSGWPSPARWPCSPRSCSSTSRPRPSTPR